MAESEKINVHHVYGAKALRAVTEEIREKAYRTPVIVTLHEKPFAPMDLVKELENSEQTSAENACDDCSEDLIYDLRTMGSKSDMLFNEHLD